MSTTKKINTEVNQEPAASTKEENLMQVSQPLKRASYDKSKKPQHQRKISAPLSEADHKRKAEQKLLKKENQKRTGDTLARDFEEGRKHRDGDQDKGRIAVGPNQETHRLYEAQELLHHLQEILTEGDVPAVEILSDGLKRVEVLTSQVAEHPNLDSETSKTLEDISELLTSARQLARNKGIADHLQKISEESTKALQATRRKDMPVATRDATRKLYDYISAWRPVFYLLMRSRDFRQLIVDTVRIVRRVIYSYGDEFEESKQKFMEGASVRELASHVKERTEQMETPEMSEDEWNLLWEDLQGVLVVLAKEPTYKEGINRIFVLLDMFQKSVLEKDIPSNVIPKDKHLRTAIKETEELVASFSGREAFGRFKKHLRNLIRVIQKNKNLSSYLYELKDFILKTKAEEEVQTEEFRSRCRNLVYRGRDLMRELKEDDDVRPFLRSADEMLENIKHDELLQLLRQQAGIVRSDLSYVDSEGKIQMDTAMLGKLKGVLLAILADALKYIPLPKIENRDEKTEFYLDNLVLCSYDLIPDKIRIHLESDSELNMRELDVNNTNTNLVIQLDLRTELKDVEFYFAKKHFPKFEEKGRVTFRLSGDGARLTLTYAVEQGPQDTVPRMTKGFANFDISKMTLDFDTSTLKHPVMVPMLTTVFKTLIIHRIEKAIESNLSVYVGKLGDKITTYLTEVNRPILSGIDVARKAVKSSQLAEVYQKRQEKLLE